MRKAPRYALRRPSSSRTEKLGHPLTARHTGLLLFQSLSRRQREPNLGTQQLKEAFLKAKGAQPFNLGNLPAIGRFVQYQEDVIGMVLITEQIIAMTLVDCG
jgi:hypothetical protein